MTRARGGGGRTRIITTNSCLACCRGHFSAFSAAVQPSSHLTFSRVPDATLPAEDTKPSRAAGRSPGGGGGGAPLAEVDCARRELTQASDRDI